MTQTFTELLEEEYKNAKNDPSKGYFVAIVDLPNTPSAEIIMNPRANFESKIPYYVSAYDETGALKNNPNVKIVAYSFVTDLEKAMEYIYNFS